MTSAVRAALVAVALILLGFLTVPARAQPVARDEQSALTSAKSSMVRVTEVTFYDGQPQLVGWGSGFVIAPGYVVTNYHVVEEAYRGQAGVMVTPAASTEGRPVVGTVVRVWGDADLALVRVDGLTAPALVIATGEPEQTKPVRALGYPGATCLMLGCTGRDIVEPAQPNATEGTIAVFENRAPNGAALPTIFHTAEISSGNSGGPLIDRCGRVIGVNTWTASGQVDMDGHIDLPGGQHVASRASTLVSFLDQAGVTFTSESGVCMTASDVAAAEAQRRLDEAEKAVRELQRQREAERLAAIAAKAKAEADRRSWALDVAVAALVAALGGGAYLLWRRRSVASAAAPPAAGSTPIAGTSEAPATQFSISAPALLVFGVGALGLVGLLIVIIGPKPAPVPADSTDAPPPSGVQRLDCVPDPSASFGPNPATPVSFIFDSALQCVNGRTAYSVTAGGYERYIVHRDEPSISHNLITRDLKTFTQEEFAVPRDQWRAWTAAIKRPPECATSIGGLAPVEARLGATAGLRSQLPSMPVAKALRRCTYTR